MHDAERRRAAGRSAAPERVRRRRARRRIAHAARRREAHGLDAGRLAVGPAPHRVAQDDRPQHRAARARLGRTACSRSSRPRAATSSSSTPTARRRAASAPAQPSVGPATMTSDGTVVFTTSAGDAVGIRRTSPRPRFVTRIGGERNVARRSALARRRRRRRRDGDGPRRARLPRATCARASRCPRRPSAALLASGDKVIAVTATGAVYGWTPGREPVRLGSFGAPIDGGAALADASTLVAVIEGNHLVELDLARGARTLAFDRGARALSRAAQRAAAGRRRDARDAPRADGEPRVRRHHRSRAVRRRRARPSRPSTPRRFPTAGPRRSSRRAHTGPLVDARGAVAFAAPEDGHVGVVGPEGAVDTIGELICTRTSRSAGIAGLTPLGRGAFAVTCESGAVAKITGARGRLATPHGPRRSSAVGSPCAAARVTRSGRRRR